MAFNCELFVKKILPNIRAESVRILIKRGMKKSDIAKTLGITKSAVTQYEKKIRGNSNDKRIKIYAKKIAENILKGKEYSKVLCEACVKLGGNESGCAKN